MDKEEGEEASSRQIHYTFTHERAEYKCSLLLIFSLFRRIRGKLLLFIFRMTSHYVVKRKEIVFPYSHFNKIKQ